jgi:hypothetical protein
LVRRQYEINREAATRRYERALNTLRNSEGWRGVFGEEFARDLRNNEDLLREWAETGNQAALLLRVSYEGLAQTFRGAYAALAQGMRQAIAQAIVMRQSIGEAVRHRLRRWRSRWRRGPLRMRSSQRRMDC